MKVILLSYQIKGWSDLMKESWEAVGLDKAPTEHYTLKKLWSIFFILVFFFGNLMILNTFIGILIEKFLEIKNSFSKNNLFRRKIFIFNFH